MKRLNLPLRSIMPVLVLFLFIDSGCTKKTDDGKIPITTSSEEARREFLKGRELAERLLGANAIIHFDKAIALDPNFAVAHLNRANVATTAKEFFDHLRLAVDASGGASEGERLLVLAAEAGANADTRKQEELLGRLLAAFPRDERAQFNAGGFYFGQQNYDRAIEHYKRAIEIAPDYSPAYNLLGYAYRQVENYPEAEKVFKKYTELIPDDPNPYDSFAELLMKEGKFDESITYYRKALRVEPYFVPSRVGIAMNYMYKGMHAEGFAELDTLHEMARNEGELRQGLFTKTVLLIDAGRMNDALKEMDAQYSMAEKLDDSGQMALDLGFTAAILLETGKTDEALACYDKALQIVAESDLSQEIKDNTRLFSHVNRAAVAIVKKELDVATKHAEEFQKGAETNNNPNQIRMSHELFGRIALAAKEYDKAIVELQKANQQDPYNLYRLGLAFQGAKNAVESKRYLERAAHFNGLPALNMAFVRTKAEKMLANIGA